MTSYCVESALVWWLALPVNICMGNFLSVEMTLLWWMFLCSDGFFLWRELDFFMIEL